MIKKLSFIILILPFLGFSQSSIYGVLKDSLSNPIEFANVVITDFENNVIVGTTSNKKGLFKLSCKDGIYKLKISFVGYTDWEKEVVLKKVSDIGVVTLIESKNELQEIVLVSKKPIIKRKVDRLVFNVENSIASSGGDALGVLQKAPGIHINKGNIQLIGKSKVRVLINGKLSPLSGEDLSGYLQSINSNDISKVEVITNPPSKYEAEGNSGLVNIILKKTKKDHLSGNVSATYQQATYPTANLGSGITYQKNKWSLFGNVNSSNGSISVDEKNDIYYNIQKWNTNSKIRYFKKMLFGRAGIDYDISNKVSLGIQYLGATNEPDNTERTVTNIFDAANMLDSLLITDANSDKRTYYHSMNGHLKTVFDTIGKSMSLDLDYFVYNNSLDRVNVTNFFLTNGNQIKDSNKKFRNTSNQNIELITSGIDFELPTKSININLGGKLSYMNNESGVEAYDFKNNIALINLDQTNLFDYQENTQSIYANVSKSLKKWSFKLGSRIEFTQTEGNSITLNQINKNNYNKLFPTLYVSYSSNDNNSLSLNYGKRINRPSYSSLNPFRWFSNPFSYTEGNPFLQPSFVDNFELSHLHKNNLSTTAYLSMTENGSDQITLVDSISNIQSTVRKNFLNEYTVGLSQSYTLKTIKWIESYFQYDFSYSKIKSSLPNTVSEQEGINFYTSINNSLYFNTEKTLLGEVNFWYYAPSVSGVDKITESYAFDIAAKYYLLDRQLQVSLVATDIFRTDISTIKSIVNSLRQEYKNYYDNRRLRISVTYRFGNGNLRGKKKQFSNEEERQRTN